VFILFAASVHLEGLTLLNAVIAGLTRNLPSDEDSSLHLGDGGCSSAMTLKS
jgi:hypothetical protein